jgi:hypothetical protein
MSNSELSSNKQNKGLKRNTIDKYYTKIEIAEECVESVKQYIKILKDDLIIEPSAGNGAFIQSIKLISKNYNFYDLEPENDEIVIQDFLNLEYNKISEKYKNIHVIGNPPFGRQSSLAIKFIKKCCFFASSISFILPKSFKKESMKRHFFKNFHLMFEIDLKEKSFLVNGIETNVECIFQIWEKKTEERKQEIKLKPINFEFVKKENDPDISFRRIGNAGTISKATNDKNINSHYFIKFINNKSIDDNIEQLKRINFHFNNTVAAKSISKQELISEFNKLLINI